MIFTVCQRVEKSWEHKSKAMWGNMSGMQSMQVGQEQDEEPCAR